MTKGELTNKEIGRKAVRAAAALGLRQAFVQGLNILGGVLLANLLLPSQFGVYGIIMFVLMFIGIFGSTGLAANLIRHGTEPTLDEYKSVFTFQQAIVFVTSILIWVFAPQIESIYQLPDQNGWLFRFIAVSMFISSFMVIPQVQLERRLDFNRLAFAEVFQALIFNLSAVVLAWLNYGVISFGIAILLRFLTGAIIVNYINPWPIGWKVSLKYSMEHLHFGLVFQAGQLVNLFKDSIYPLFIGVAAGSIALGFINFAGLMANLPVMLVALLNRLYMPMFARLAKDRESLRLALRTTLIIICVITYALSSFIFVFRQEIVSLFGEEWLPAVALFAPLVLINILLVPSLVIIAVLNALGKATYVLKLQLAWALGNWLLGPLFILNWGWEAWPWALLVVNFSSLLAWNLASKLTGLNWWDVLSRPLGGMFAIYLLSSMLELVDTNLTVKMAIAVLILIGVSLALLRQELRLIWRLLV
ncbi:MAG: oligosaccharide flippase family protein [Fischerella sp.]|nr:oligosaccharide flippase family protein [Fischerella sp.]